MNNSLLKRTGLLFTFMLSLGLVCTEKIALLLISPANCILVFDIDDVLLEMPNWTKAKALWKEKAAVAKNFWRPGVIRKMYKIAKNSAAAEELATEFNKKKPELARLIRRIAHSKVPVKGMIEILRELKALGYTLHIASNMGKNDFEFYKKKYPGIFNLFDEVLVIEYVPGQKVVKKPDSAYFKLYNAKFPTNKTHLFIDDKQGNCEASGFADTIVFKSAHQLRSELRARNIL